MLLIVVAALVVVVVVLVVLVVVMIEEGSMFYVGAVVMLVIADGSSRSTYNTDAHQPSLQSHAVQQYVRYAKLVLYNRSLMQNMSVVNA